MREELKNAERLHYSDFSIVLEKQKERLQHCCNLANASELHDLQITSNHGCTFLQRKPQANDPVLPSLSKRDEEGRISNQEFARIFSLRMGLVFDRKITATNICKIITAKMRDQPVHIQSAAAIAKGYSVQVGHNYYKSHTRNCPKRNSKVAEGGHTRYQVKSASWSSGNAFDSGAGSLRFISRIGQIGHSVANGSPPLRHFF